jgi:hypothetical protein
MAIDIWTYRDTMEDVDLTGFAVEAVDGEIGKVDDASYEVGSGSIVVSTGPWILGRKVLLPAGTIDDVDLEEGIVRVDRTKDEIKEAPEYDPTGYVDQERRIALAEYYARFYG